MTSVFRSVSSSVQKRSVHNPLKVPPALSGSGSGTPFDPDLASIQSRILDGGTIWTDAISSKYYLKDQSTDNTHLPRQGRCWLFDGSNDYGTHARITSGSVANLSVFGWLKLTSATGFTALVGEYDNNTGNRQWILANNAGKINVICSVDGTNTGLTAKDYSTTTTLSTGVWYHVGFTFAAGTLKLFINGAEASVTKTQDPAIATIYNGSAALNAGAFAAGTSGYLSGSLRDIRIHSSAKDSTAVAAIYNQSLTGNGAFDSTGLLAAYPCNEESGTTGYDISGNGNHLTLTNITQATFHAADGVLTNRNNDEGYRLSGSVYIPKRLSDSLAADGNALTVTGRAAYHGCLETPSVTNHSGTVYIAAAHLVGTETVVSYSGSTATPTISAGRIDWQSGQTLSDLTLSDGTQYTMQEGPGSGNTNRTIYNVNGSSNHGTLTNGTVAAIWGTRLAGTAKDWCVLYGGRIGAAGEFIPGRVSGSLAADGNAKTLTAGKHGNPFSRINLNPATAAEFNGRSIPTASAVAADINAAVTPAESAFRRTDTDGDDRFLIYESALTGSDLSNVENYVS